MHVHVNGVGTCDASVILGYWPGKTTWWGSYLLPFFTKKRSPKGLFFLPSAISVISAVYTSLLYYQAVSNGQYPSVIVKNRVKNNVLFITFFFRTRSEEIERRMKISNGCNSIAKWFSWTWYLEWSPSLKAAVSSYFFLPWLESDWSAYVFVRCILHR